MTPCKAPHLALMACAALLALPAAAPAQDAAQGVAQDAAQDAAQGAATLVADRVTLTGANLLVAEGNVEMFHQGRRLTARRVIYDDAAGTVRLTGPIRLSEPGEAGSVLVADAAELDRALENGILTGARLVLARELQLAAARIRRSEGRYTTLDRVVASSCEVCVSAPTPLWEIRAARVTHDAQTRQLAFEDAQLRAFGVPVAWLPRLSLPDPTVTRARGVLRPSFRSSTKLGTGISLPYFLPLGDHHDVTLTPYATDEGVRSLGIATRHALTSGTLSWEGALTRDRLRPGDTRGYLFGHGSFALPRDYRLGMQVQVASDRDYLSDHHVTEADRLWSGLTLDRVRGNQMVLAALGNFHTLREGESNATQPSLTADLTWERHWTLNGPVGGEAGLRIDGLAFRRNASADAIGRDMARLGARADWRRLWLLPQGMLATTEAALALDHYMIGDDPAYASTVTRLDPTAAVELRWPWMASAAGVTQVIEPVARLDVSRNSLPAVPNEDSRLAELDEENLFAPSRFPGQDARETGTRLALGIGWTRVDPAGWSLGLAAGRIWRSDTPVLPSASLSGSRRSDWLLAAHFTRPDGFSLSSRTLVDDKADIRRSETRLAWANDRVDLSAGYLWMRADPYEGRADKLSELVLDSGFDIGRGWHAGVNGRYDFAADRAERAGLNLGYANECVTVDLSLSHRRTSSTSVSSDTDIGLSVRLTGFGAGGSDKAKGPVRRRCLR